MEVGSLPLVGEDCPSETRNVDATEMTRVLQRLGNSLVKLANSSDIQTSTVQNIRRSFTR